MEHTGCLFCDPVFVPLIEMKLARHVRPMHRAGGDRGRGGRSGRGGRGRGRGRGKPKDKMSQLASYFVWTEKCQAILCVALMDICIVMDITFSTSLPCCLL